MEGLFTGFNIRYFHYPSFSEHGLNYLVSRRNFCIFHIFCIQLLHNRHSHTIFNTINFILLLLRKSLFLDIYAKLTTKTYHYSVFHPDGITGIIRRCTTNISKRTFNRSTLKLYYSCMSNVKSIITSHNTRIIRKSQP